eukprot:500608_1
MSMKKCKLLVQNRHDYCDQNTKCIHLQNFVKIMNEYMTDNIMTCITNMNEQSLSSIVNNYLHLLHEHDDDYQFEFIKEQLNECELGNCNKFKRNNRNRMYKQTQTKYGKEIEFRKVCMKIMDKMHCYFCHCFDIGNRFKIQQKKLIENSKFNLDCLVNQQITKIYELLKPTRQSNSNINSTAFKKFNILTDDHQYHFGYPFAYGYDYEHIDEASIFLQFDWIKVSAKYNDLKEELTSNNISQINIQQFNTEYQKANIHFNSYFCKKKYRPFYIYDNGEEKHISRDLILALMFYCNYTNLQYEFSKTYRLDKGKNHSEFYWLGRKLKRCLREFGTEMQDGGVTKVYHGITQQLLFPQYVGYSDGGTRTWVETIHIPLSTSSSYVVATNFTNDNQGLIIQFEGKTPKYFSVSWLSDFGNEKEYLFVQNENVRHLSIGNIIDAREGLEYNYILDVLIVINKIFTDKLDEKQIITNSMFQMIKALISNQLSKAIEEYQSFNSLTEYGKKICNRFFQNAGRLCINYSKWKQKYKFLVEILFYQKEECINVKLLNALFPEMWTLQLNEVNLCSLLLDDILNVAHGTWLHNDPENYTRNPIYMTPTQHSQLSVHDALQKYSHLYRKAKLFIYKQQLPNTLCIWNNMSPYEFVVERVLRSMGNIDFVDVDDEITNLINGLIDSLSKSEHLDECQQSFHDWCIEETSIAINLRALLSNQNVPIFHRFYLDKYEWINLRMINKIYPNIEKISLTEIRLCEYIYKIFFCS